MTTLTYNRQLSQLGEFVGVNTTTNNITFKGIVTAESGFVGSASTTAPAVKIDIVGSKIRFSVVGIGSTSFNLV